jgi:hypothetical protein
MHQHPFTEDLDEGREGDALYPTQKLFAPRLSRSAPSRCRGLIVHGQNSCSSNADQPIIDGSNRFWSIRTLVLLIVVVFIIAPVNRPRILYVYHPRPPIVLPFK